MQGTNEFMSEEEVESGKIGRSIGLIMIPGQHIRNIQIRKQVNKRTKSSEKKYEQIFFPIFY